MFKANTLIAPVQKTTRTFKPDLLEDASTIKLQRFAANLSDVQLQKIGIPPKFWPIFRKLNKVFDSYYLLFYDLLTSL